jgi:hypothetical protein
MKKPKAGSLTKKQDMAYDKKMGIKNNSAKDKKMDKKLIKKGK